MKKKILIITGRYLPGYKDGGPVRTIKNLTDYLGEEYEFRILTCDRDHGDDKSYPNIKVNDWNVIGKASVYYVFPKKFTLSIIKRLASNVDIVYVCGCYSDYAINTLILKRLNLIRKPVVVAAMGLFTPGAMSKKRNKYKFFLKTFKFFGMFSKIKWSTTSEYEAECVRNTVDKKAVCYIAEDLPRIVEKSFMCKEKKRGAIKAVFLSRISPEKNLLKAIEILSGLQGRVEFAIYGPIHDELYWKKCLEKLEHLPDNVEWCYNGEIASEEVVDTFRKYHIFIFPTEGENYGHVIHEALSAGCLVITSDRTPWKDLKKHNIGISIALDNLEEFRMAILNCLNMDACEFNHYADNAVRYAMKKSEKTIKNTGYRKIFDME